MNLDYNIFWVEDLDESFNTYSRRIKRYVESRYFRCNIFRVKTQVGFDINRINLNDYDILIVDYRLGDKEDGREIIKAVRQGKYYHDVLFYSGEGETELLRLIYEQGIEGVYVSDRNNQVFIPKIRALIDKSIKRTIDPVNIRGMIMDVTSGFDNDMAEIISNLITVLSDSEKDSLKEYIVHKIIKERKGSFDNYVNKYSNVNDVVIVDLLNEHEFTAAMRAKLLNKLMQCKNPKVITAVKAYFEIIAKDTESRKVKFFSEYHHDILVFRNALAHVKMDACTNGDVHIGPINGVDYICGEEFCDTIRKNLLAYNSFFSTLRDETSKMIASK